MLHHIAVLASERAPSQTFYEALGFSVTDHLVRPEQHDEILWMTGHGVTLELFVDATHPPRVSNPEAYGLRHVALRVGDASAMHGALVRQGFFPEPLRTDPHDGQLMFFIKDPDGLPVELHE